MPPPMSIQVKRILLTVFLMMPFVLVAALLYAFSATTQRMHAPPIGAGAGHTGGANALGELLAGNTTTGKPRQPAPTAGSQTQSTPEKDDAPPPPSAPSQEVTPPAPAAGSLVRPESLASGFVLIVEDKARKASAASPIFLAGSFNNWNPADESFKLEPQSDMKWRIVLDPAKLNGAEQITFKFTRGSWELEELDDDFNKTQNRILEPIDPAAVPAGEMPRIEMTVLKWGDQRPDAKGSRGIDPYQPLEVTGALRRIQVSGGGGPARGLTRDVLIWLPPSYEELTADGSRLQVLYLHDAQNVFDIRPGVPGEWRADETATSLIASSEISPIVIVAIPHANAHRISEYLPGNMIRELAGRKIESGGDEYVEWLVHDVKPRIERSFKVATDPARVAIGGSSLGAAIALHAAAKHPEQFGMALLESLPLRTGDAQAWQSWVDGISHWPAKVYLGVGTRERGDKPADDPGNRGYVAATQDIVKHLPSSAHANRDYLLVVEDDATHTESAWAGRFPTALRFLFPPTQGSK